MCSLATRHPMSGPPTPPYHGPIDGLGHIIYRLEVLARDPARLSDEKFLEIGNPRATGR